MTKSSSEHIIRLCKQAEYHRKNHEYEESESLYLEALELQKELIEQNNDYPIILNNLAVLYNDMGRYEDAERLSTESLEILKSITGKENPVYSNVLNTLALSYRLQGKYSKAEPLIRQNLAIMESVLGRESVNYIQCVSNLAGLHKAMGEYDIAEPLYKEALEIRGKVYGIEHPSYATGLNNLASLYISKKLYEKAEPLLKQALKIREKTQGDRNPNIGIHLQNLASIYSEQKLYDKAESTFLEALKYQERILGKKHPQYADSLYNLAWSYFESGNYKKAKSLFHETVEIRRQILGEYHPKYAKSLNYLAWSEVAVGKHKDALVNMLKGIEINRQVIFEISSISDEKRLEEFIRSSLVDYFGLLSHFIQNYPKTRKSTSSVLDAVLKHKGLSREIYALKRDRINKNKNPELNDTFKNLKECRLVLSKLIHAEANENTPENYPQKINALWQQIANLEKEISARIPHAELRGKLENINSSIIVEHLPNDVCLIEFVRVKNIDFTRQNQRSSSDIYLAFILFGNNDSRIPVAKFEASEIDYLIGWYRSEIIKVGQRNIKIVPHKDIVSDSNEVEAGLLLYEKLFQPLLKKVNRIKKFIISPDSHLTLLPFEVILQKNGKYVIEDFEISYVDSGRDILRFRHHEEPKSPALIVADPDFDLKNNNYTHKRALKETSLPMGRSISGSKNSFRFTRLNGAKAEGEIIRNLLGSETELWVGEQALDGRVKLIQGPEILHFATHGYYLPFSDKDEEDYFNKFSNLMGMDDLGMEPIIRELFTDINSNLGIKNSENPFLSSGLALAGANTFLQKGELVDDIEDGLLTALDVTGLDLIGTDLVVLSACDSGIGEVKLSEGIYGLRRAFILAGARTLISSLWLIRDDETKVLMINFYKKILQGMGKAQALRESQLEMIQTFRKNGKSDSPFYWGAFVCIGNPGFNTINQKPDSFWKKLLRID